MWQACSARSRGRHKVPFQRMQCAQQSRSETAGGTHAGAGWDIGKAHDLKVRSGYPSQLQSLANDGMLDFINALDIFEFGVLDDDAGTKRFIDGDVDVAVNRRGEDKASMLPVVGREVGATAAETNPQRTPGNDHRADPPPGRHACAGIILKSYAKRRLEVECQSATRRDQFVHRTEQD